MPLEAVLIAAGFQVPLMPFVDEAGNAGAVLFWHKGPIAEKDGVTWLVTVISSEALTAHCPFDGVKV